MPARVSSAQFVGRAGELGVLDSALGRAAGGTSAAVLVGGEAGIGKSRLIAEFERRASDSGALALVGECVDLAGGELPYGPVVAALRPLVGDGSHITALGSSARATLARLWPALAEAGTSAHEPAEYGQGQLFEAVHGLLAAAAVDQPLALVIEDLQWADRSTRDLLTFLIRNSRGQRTLFVASYRSDELHRGHPLHPFVTELERSGGAERIELHPFDAVQISELIAGILGEQPDRRLASRLAQRSEGNPFFAEELLAAAADEGVLPESLRDALLVRIERLSAGAREVLRLTAAAGRSVSHPLLVAAADRSDAELGEALREAVAKRVLVASENGYDYEFRHSLMREAVYADLLPGERAALHLRLAQVLEAEPGLAASRGAAPERAHHWHVAGDAARALAASLEAAEQAGQVHAYAEAVLHLERALELWDRTAPEQRPVVRELDIVRRAAEASMVSGEQRRAIALGRKVLDGIDPGADPVASALAHERLARYLWVSGAGDDALPHYQAAVRLVPAEPPSHERALVLAAHAHYMLLSGHMAEAAVVAEEALGIARSVGARHVEANVLCTLGPALAEQGDVDAALDAFRTARAIAEELGSVAEIGRSYTNESQSLEGSGRLRESVRVTQRGIERAMQMGAQRLVGDFLVGDLASRLFRLGEWDEAVAHAAGIFDRSPTSLNAAGAHTPLGRIAIGRGDFETGEEHLADAAELAGRAGGPMFLAPIYVACAESSLWRGDPEATRATLLRAFAEIGDFDILPFTAELHSLHVRAEVECALRARLLSRAEEAAGAEAAARARADELRRSLPQGHAAPEGLADLLVAEAELSRLADRAEPEPWLQAAAAWEALEQPYRAAYAAWRAAEALVAAGDRDAAQGQLASAGAVAERLMARPLAGEIESLARRARITATAGDTVRDANGASELGLTDREREVLELLTTGRTNRQIGAELFMSEKTASVHVSRILQKLGVANRAEAAGVAHTLGLRPHQAD